MFGKISRMKQDHSNELRQLHFDHELVVEQYEFNLEHFETKELRHAKDTIIEQDKDLAVIRKELEMIERVVDINADLIDVKDLVKNLIEKLPEINITSLPGAQKEGKKKN